MVAGHQGREHQGGVTVKASAADAQLDRTVCRVYVLSGGASQAPGIAKTVPVQVLLAVRVLTRAREHDYECGAVFHVQAHNSEAHRSLGPHRYSMAWR